MNHKIKVGMLRRKYGSNLETAKACSLIAEREGLEFFYFSIDDVDFNTQSIRGDVYKNGKWIEGLYPFPDIIYNDFGKKYKDKYKALEKSVLFTAHAIGNKTNVHKILENDATMKDYLIPTEDYKNIKQLHDYIKKYNKVVLKPISSNHGKGIIYIESNNGFYIINHNGKTFRTEKKELNEYIESEVIVKYLIQPFIESKTKDGLPFDIRAHLNKNGDGVWVNTSIYARIGISNGIVSNGAYISILNKFLKIEFGKKQYKSVKKKLEKFSLEFAHYFQNLYKDSFDEIGLDLALDKEANIYIFEVNVKPDHQDGFLSLKAAENLIPYAKHLVQNYHPNVIDVTHNNNNNELELFFGGNTFINNHSSKDKQTDYFKHLHKLYKNADVKTVNLQGCKSNTEQDFLHLNIEQFDIYNLINNSNVNYNKNELKNMIDNLDNLDSTILGIGDNNVTARKGVKILKGKECVGLLHYVSSDQTNNLAFHNKSGFAPLIEKNVYQDIAYLKRQGAKQIIVSIDWGREISSITTKEREQIDLLINAGADVIIGQGTNQFFPVEWIGNVPVFYNLGYFVNKNNKLSKSDTDFSYSISLNFESNTLSKIKIWPIKRDKKLYSKQVKGKAAKHALNLLLKQSDLTTNSRYKINKDHAEILL